MKTQIAPDNGEDATEADAVVCNPTRIPSIYTDNVYGECHTCGQKIYWRPHVPAKARKLCYPCALHEMAQNEKAGNEVVLTATQKTCEEVNAFVKSKLQ